MLPAHHCISNACQLTPTTTGPSSTWQRPVNSYVADRRHRNVVKMLCMPLVSTLEQSRLCSSYERDWDTASTHTFLEQYSRPSVAALLFYFEVGHQSPCYLTASYRYGVWQGSNTLVSADLVSSPRDGVLILESTRIRLQVALAGAWHVQRGSLAVAL